MSEALLTVDEAAQRLRMHPATLLRQLRAGQARAVRTGKLWRIPESALLVSNSPGNAPAPTVAPTIALEMQAATILTGLDSDDSTTRNAAIVALARANAQTSALVEEAIARSIAAYDGPEDDFSAWRALDGEAFHFPEAAKEAEAEGKRKAEATP